MSVSTKGDAAPSLVDRALFVLRMRRNNKVGVADLEAGESELVLDTRATPAWVGWAAALLITAAPLLTIAGGEWLAVRARTDTARLEAASASRRAALAKAAEARAMLRGAIVAPAVGATLDTLATLLPPEDRLVAVGADAAGVLAVEIATVDPDRLRAAIRGSRLAGLREAGQRRGDAVLIVRWAGRAG